MTQAILTRDLTRCFGSVVAVNQLNLSVPERSLYGLIGPNGAGKTTTLRMLAGLLEPSSGVIRINGLAIRDYWREIQWHIGYMPDFFGVYDNLLVWEYLDFFARCYNLSSQKRQKIVTELLDLVDLGSKRDAYVHTLSRGMRQRLCLAHSLVHDPQILLLDEPASGLDPRSRVEMRELLRELKHLGKTIILSSHILSELANLCDEIGIVEKGNLVASGSIATIRQKYLKSRSIQIKTLSNPNAVVEHLMKEEYVRNITSPEEGDIQVVFEFTGDKRAAADLLQRLVEEQKFRISDYGERSTDLEELFLELTSGEVA